MTLGFAGLFNARSGAALVVALSLAACGGGGSLDDPQPSQPSPLTFTAPAGPPLTGNTATDGFNRLNFRRQQMGLGVLSRNARVDVTAQSHADYQRINGVTTHVQEIARPGFTGVQLGDRLRAGGYVLPGSGYAFGEVVWSRSGASGADAIEDLAGSIYDRFTLFEPMYKEGGAGASSAGGTTWFTADLVVIGLDGGLPRGAVAVYPFAGQTGVPTGQNAASYPVSVHANLVSTLAVQAFTIRPRGGADMQVRTLAYNNDPSTPASAAAVIPLSALSPATTYDVQFTGTVDGIAVNRAWSFTTQ